MSDIVVVARTCPHCGGEIKAAARVCKHCRESVEPDEQTAHAATSSADLAVAVPTRVEKHPLESSAFGVVVVGAGALWLLLVLGGVGLVLLPSLAFSTWLSQQVLLAYAHTSALRVGPTQLPHIWRAYVDVGRRLGLAQLPPLYIRQEGGLINAFAARAGRKKQVMVMAGLLDAVGDDEAALKFILGHELGHHIAQHTNSWKPLLLAPLDMIVVGVFAHTALSRGQEFTADRYGCIGCGDVAGAERAMLALTAGRWGREADVAVAMSQERELTLWNHLMEISATHPNFIRRIEAMRAFSGRGQP